MTVPYAIFHHNHTNQGLIPSHFWKTSAMDFSPNMRRVNVPIRAHHDRSGRNAHADATDREKQRTHRFTLHRYAVVTPSSHPVGN